ncbi:MAG TPA: DUF3667 domain-containing protein [Puia sp.]|nr:DUF3667 domain-containing protein [Puia sp.]
MSHLKERKEKVCLNCKSDLYGRYCHVCGQENLEPKESVWHLIQHFFNDITHFDGKFFSTGKYLLKKPGFLSAEYMAGRRASYLNPIRMYVFTSAIFFIIFFSLKSPKDMVNVNSESETKKEKGKGLSDLVMEKTGLDTSIAKIKDTDDRKDAEEKQAKLVVEIEWIKKNYGDTTTRKFSKQDRAMLLLQAYADTASAEEMPPFVRASLKKASRIGQNADDDGSNFFGLHQGRYKSLAQYDSTERALPDSLKDGWFQHLLMRRLVLTEEEFHKDKKSYFEHFAENMLHSFPKILFFSLPFFALILRILYIRRKQYYYVSHGIFAIHVYCATFILTLGVVVLDRLTKFLDYRWFNIVGGLAIFLLILYWFIYLFKAMRRFYGQGRGKTFIKYILLSGMAFTINMILLVIFLLISAIFI